MEQNELDNAFMYRALELADESFEAGEVPVGAVLVGADGILGEGRNRLLETNDPTAHAEMLALRQGAQNIGNYRLPGCTLYVTIEPCLMCFGALTHARINRLVFGAREPKAGAVVSFRPSAEMNLNHQFSVTEGVLAEECASRMGSFFATRRRSGRMKKKPSAELSGT